MKQLVAIIKLQIQQLNNLQLSEWLLSHLKEDANNLTELFTKQFPARSHQVPVVPSFIGQFSSYLSVLSIFYIYAAEFLRQELVDKLLASPELIFEDKPTDNTTINRVLMEQLTVYREAWPIIVALQKQGASDLIQILNSAEEHTLRSFASLAEGSDLAILVDAFLAKNNKELEAIDRTRLVHFLRQADLARWFTEYLELLVGKASNVMSLKLLMLTFTSGSNEFKLAEIKALLADYPFPLHREAMQAVIYFYSFQAKKAPSSRVSGDFIALFYDLMKRIDVTMQRELVLALNQECFILVIEQCLEGMASLDLTLQQTGKGLLLLLCSETVIADKQYRDLIVSRLKRPDLYLFDTPELFELAKEILAAAEGVPDGSAGDLWIEALLISPRFVAKSSPKILKQLSDRYLALCGEHQLQTLWMRLEKSCQQQKAHDEEVAENALEVLYRYYGQTVPNLRTDLLLRTVDYIYRPMMNSIIGLDKERSVLLFWFKQYLPQHPLAQVEGLHTESGQIGSADLWQRNTSAQLLAKVPEQDLEQAPEGLALLIQNMLQEDSLAELYDDGATLSGDAKRLWLAQRISMTIREAEYPISSTTFNSLVNHQSNAALFSLLATMKHGTNARFLFHAILNDDKKREALFRGLFEPELEVFLEHHDAVACLADYMAHYHDKPWFSEGLRCFADYGKKQKRDSLLSDALAQLAKETDKEGVQGALVDKVLKSLIGSEETAKVVLQDFLHDRGETPVQQLKSPEINKVTHYFCKQHLVVALQALNKTTHWQNSPLYKLVLHLLETQHEQLFPSRELNLTAESWQKNELNDLACFISRHLSKKRSLDSDFSVGHRVLSELIFSGANAGQISLFYREKIFNPVIARMSFTHSFLERLVDKFWIPEGVKEKFADTVSRIKAWFDDQSPLQKELKNNPILADWRHLLTQTWKEINKKKLPIICAYLLSYSGSKRPLSFLLRDYFNTFQENPDYLYPVVKLLQQFPQRDVSAAIFDVLEVMIIKNPLFLDETVLHYMAHYHASKSTNQEIKSPQAELNLLIYFGQRKHYAVVQRGCEELAKNCEDKQLKKRLLQGALEAEVETDLSSSQGYFYFNLVKVFKRLWHYGINAKRNSSGMVSFCDDASPRPIIKRAPAEVETPVISGKVSAVYLGFTERQKQLIRLLATIKHSPDPALLITRPSQISQSLFHEKGETQETVVAQEQAVVHI